MELSDITPKKHERTFSMLSGLTVGLFIMILFNLSGNSPDKFVIMFHKHKLFYNRHIITLSSINSILFSSY